ncbi:sulfotransferase [Pseudoalteromonas carrageenovora]|uniref:sulfotransferase n=1 Tax=Pseudoalteromonas carrageenovora TaxID=227 RepID=UPI0026E4771A|nr:sulfotransferase [Pseudoalteromonas carrageenovora]MDO6546035.1 sulfotransferase [Pseudoalteromonas carrageenovora]MDO6831181.1 sulfotransferase [Pseudoalteromonas carrageenovora]
MNKLFIIGLPRTGTTSVCHAFLELSIATAHTAYTQACFKNATAIADTPIFNDYQVLDKHYPGSKFIYLERELSAWLPSIKQLLTRMHTNLTRADGGFNIHIKRCYLNTFNELSLENINDDSYLENCYNRHFESAQRYFKNRPQDFLSIDIAKPASYKAMCDFLELTSDKTDFEKMNMGGKVTAWNDIKHVLKVESTAKGRIDKHLPYQI